MTSELKLFRPLTCTLFRGNNFWCIVFLLGLALKLCVRFLKFCFKLGILIFLFYIVLFVFYLFKLNVVFLRKKTPTVEYETHFCREAVKFNVVKY